MLNRNLVSILSLFLISYSGVLLSADGDAESEKIKEVAKGYTGCAAYYGYVSEIFKKSKETAQLGANLYKAHAYSLSTGMQLYWKVYSREKGMNVALANHKLFLGKIVEEVGGNPDNIKNLFATHGQACKDIMEKEDLGLSGRLKTAGLPEGRFTLADFDFGNLK
jgi:hypothetical protein